MVSGLKKSPTAKETLAWFGHWASTDGRKWWAKIKAGSKSQTIIFLFQGNTDRKDRRESCAEPNWWFGYGKRAVSESIWYGSFSLVRQKFDRVCRTFVELYLSSTAGTPSKSDVAPVSLHSTASEAGLTDTPFKGGTIRKLLEGGEGGRSTKAKTLKSHDIANVKFHVTPCHAATPHKSVTLPKKLPEGQLILLCVNLRSVP